MLAPSTIDGHGHTPGTRKAHLALTLAALGVVYGDIGTSPIYALRECFHLGHIEPTPGAVLGVLSLVFWALVLIVSVKYLLFVLRADNDGEGGILSLASLVISLRGRLKGRRWLIIPLGLFGAALLYGDGTITPAISVLSAVEGLEQIAPATKPYVIPITLVIITALFAVQRRGTGGIGKIFGPVTLLWFIVLAVLGVANIIKAPEVFAAINPLYGARFFVDHGWAGFLVLGSVFLVVTGGEALYADLGHFGLKPIQHAWFALVLPALLLNYFGQGALLLDDPSAVAHPFFRLSPEWALPFLVILATLATSIASQAVISGAFSLTMQLVQFGYLPKLTIVHTSEQQEGQIYLPFVNAALYIVCVVLVLTFKTSTNMAAAYGIAVTSTMAITTVLFFTLTRRRWRWPVWASWAFLLVFLPIDLAFFGANIIKIAAGGWVPLLLAAILFMIMLTWKQGRTLISDAARASRLPIGMLIDDLGRRSVERVAGTGVFFHPSRSETPSTLLHNLKHNHVLHERNLFLTVKTVSRPRVAPEDRAKIAPLGQGCYHVDLLYGFVEQPCVADDVLKLVVDGQPLKAMETSFFLRRERLEVTPLKGLARWRKQLFALMSHASADSADYYGLPAGRTIELGERVAL